MTARPPRRLLLGATASRREILLVPALEEALAPGAATELARALAAAARDFHYHLPGRRGEAPPGPAAEVDPVYGTGRAARALAPARLLARLLLPDACGVHHWLVGGDPRALARAGRLARLARRPVVHTLTTVPELDGPRRPAFFGDRTAALSEATALLLRSLGVPGVEVVRPAVTVPRHAPDRAAARRRLALARPGLLDEDGPAVLYAGALTAGQGAFGFLEAAALAWAREPRLQVVLLDGEGLAAASRRDALLARARALGLRRQVRVAARRHLDVDALLGAVDAAAFAPTDLRGHPDVPALLLLAMALGRPVVVGDLPPLAELAGLGEGALVVPTGDVARLAERLGTLAGSPGLAARLGQGARRTLGSHFRPDQMAASYEAIYRELLP